MHVEPPGGMYRLTAFDTAIASRFPLPGALPCSERDPAGQFQAEITVTQGYVDIPASAEPAGMYRYLDDTLWFPDAAIARFACHQDGRIVVEPGIGASDDLVGRLLIASALPAMLWMRRQPVLHAGAAIMPGRSLAMAVGGEAGAGKSTVLEQLVAAGARLVGDDTIRVSATGQHVLASGLPGGCYIAAGTGDRKAERVFHPVPGPLQCLSLPLGAFIHLDPPARQDNPEFVRVRGVEALELLLTARHRPEVAGILGQEADHLQDLARMSRDLTVCRWSRKKGEIPLGASEWRFLESVTDRRAP